MHTKNRLLIIALALMVVVPLSAVQITASLTQKYKAAEELDVAMEEAEHVHASGRGLFYRQSVAKEHLDEMRLQLEEAQLQKTQARRAYIVVERELKNLQTDYKIDASNTGALLVQVQQEEKKVASFLRYIRNRGYFLAGSAPDLGLVVASNLAYNTLGELTDMHVRSQAIAKTRYETFERVLLASKLTEESVELEEEYQRELKAYEEVWQQYLEAKGAYDSATNRIAEVQRITAEVDAQILALQRELARIDAKLVARLERELIEKGLMSAQPGERSDGRIRSTQTFRWPTKGRISAGFLSESYKRFFGVPHKGIDIVVPQGSPIVAAADGVVYLARDGGQYGYSYVLIGHRDGYATLYGHLSSINVSSGQEVAAGSLVGASGGTPGTYGAGPMTTGAHLHFEVIKNGAHVDPHTILP